MEEQDIKNYLQLIASDASGSLGNFDSDQHYVMAAGRGVFPTPVSAHQWMHCQPTPQNYVPFLAVADTGHPGIQKQMSYDISAEFPTLRQQNPSQLEHKMNEEFSHAFQTYSQSSVAASKDTADIKRKRSRERAYATDRCRKLRIANWLDALQELVPYPEGVGQAALLDGIMDHIKYLQCQMKDLCRNRLGGESTSNSVIFLKEHGHYFIQDQMLNGPLEEMIGKLISFNPSAATELLQSRGLVVLPTTFAEGLLESNMLNMQERGEFLISIDHTNI